MIRQDPILIASPPRSGTTMLAGLLHHHGVWVGRARTTMYPHTNIKFGSENIDIKEIFKQECRRLHYKNWEVPFPTEPLRSDVKARVESFVPHDTLWLVKTSLILVFWEFWVREYPEARWLFPVRDTDKILDSMNRHPSMAKRGNAVKFKYIQELKATTKTVAKLTDNHLFFDLEKLVDQDFDTVREVFAFLKMEPDYNLIDKWMEPDRLKR